MPGFGWLKAALSAPEDVSKLVTGAVNGLDKLKYTAEEKDDHALEVMREQAKIRLQAQAQVVEWMKATAPQAVMRRRLASLVAYMWAVAFSTPLIMLVAAVWMPTHADELRESANIIIGYVGTIDQYMLLTMGFYLGAPHVSTIVDGIVASKQGRRSVGDAHNGDAS